MYRTHPVTGATETGPAWIPQYIFVTNKNYFFYCGVVGTYIQWINQVVTCWLGYWVAAAGCLHDWLTGWAGGKMKWGPAAAGYYFDLFVWCGPGARGKLVGGGNDWDPLLLFGPLENDFVTATWFNDPWSGLFNLGS